MLEIYTDGATSNNGKENSVGGWAYIIVKDGLVIDRNNGFVNNATNNICELMAIINGCKRVREICDDEYCIVYSDSAYCINCYKDKWYKKWQTNGWINSKKRPVLNKELWEELIFFFEDTNFYFKKVKGHSNNYYNNIVDEMAVKAKYG